MPRACLLIGIDKDKGVSQLLLVQDGMELLCRCANALCVAAVHHIDDGLQAQEQLHGCIFQKATLKAAEPPKPSSPSLCMCTYKN